VGVPGNEKADHLAKEGRYIHQPSTRVTYREAKTFIKARQEIQWREDTVGYQVEKDSIHQLERNAQDTIY
jgi:hypothetical protein